MLKLACLSQNAQEVGLCTAEVYAGKGTSRDSCIFVSEHFLGMTKVKTK